MDLKPTEIYTKAIQTNFTFNSSGKSWNCSLNLPLLHPHATISSNNWNTTTNVPIPLVDSTVRNNLCHPSFKSNVKYESNSTTASSLRQYHADILIFFLTRAVIRKTGSHVYLINVTADQPVSEHSTTQWGREGCGVVAGRKGALHSSLSNFLLANRESGRGVGRRQSKN